MSAKAPYFPVNTERRTITNKTTISDQTIAILGTTLSTLLKVLIEPDAARACIRRHRHKFFHIFSCEKTSKLITRETPEQFYRLSSHSRNKTNWKLCIRYNSTDRMITLYLCDSAIIVSRAAGKSRCGFGDRDFYRG